MHSSTVSRLNRNSHIKMLKRGEACTECRRRKLKCDGARPGPCNQCGGNNRTCRYEQPPPFVPVSTVLQQRIKELEERLTRLTDARSPSAEEDAVSSITYINSSLVPPAEMTGLWWEAETLAVPVRNYLVGIFLANKHYCQFYLDVPRFLTSLTNQDTEQPHPGLLDAIYLLACYFTSRFPPHQNLERYETYFLTRARKSLADSLSFSDRLLDFLKGSNLVTAYLYMRGRFLEAYHSHCGTASCALSCGLHSIKSGAFKEISSRASKAPSLLPPPRNQVELSERILTFWPIYYWDKLGSIMTGFVESFATISASSEAVETPLPRPVEEYQNVIAGQYDHDTIQRLLEGGLPQNQQVQDEYFHFGLQLKSVTLLENASRLGKLYTTRGPDPVISERLTSLQVIATQFTQNLPQIPDAEEEEEDNIHFANQPQLYQPSHVASFRFRNLFLSHTQAYAAIIEAFAGMSEMDDHARHMGVFAAKKIVELIPKYRYADFGQSCMSAGFCWAAAGHVLGRHYQRTRDNIDQLSGGVDERPTRELAETEVELRSLANATQEVYKHYGTLIFQVQQVQQVMIDVGLEVEDPIVPMAY